MICIIDYGAGNLGSIKNMLKRLGVDACITADKDLISQSSKLILPGVGNFNYGMEMLKSSDIINVMQTKVLIEKIPILGICLGAQLMTKCSEEGNVKGLGWFDAEVKRFNFSNLSKKVAIPHMGWNYVEANNNNALVGSLPKKSKFYFVHSYYLDPVDNNDIMFYTTYSDFKFSSGLAKNNIYAVQFHPEKSHKYGLELLSNFLSL